MFANKKINFVWNSVVIDMLSKDRVEGVKLKNVQTQKESTLVTDTVFVAIGNTPNTEIFKNQIDKDEDGYVRVYNEAKTNVDGSL